MPISAISIETRFPTITQPKESSARPDKFEGAQPAGRDAIDLAIAQFLACPVDSVETAQLLRENALDLVRFVVSSKKQFESFAQRSDAKEIIQLVSDKLASMPPELALLQSALVNYEDFGIVSQRAPNAFTRSLFEKDLGKKTNLQALLNHLNAEFNDDPVLERVLSELATNLAAFQKNPFEEIAAWGRLANAAADYNDQIGENGDLATLMADAAAARKKSLLEQLNRWAQKKPKIVGDNHPIEPFLPAKLATPGDTPKHLKIEWRYPTPGGESFEIRFIDEFEALVLDSDGIPLVSVRRPEEILPDEIFHHFADFNERPLFVEDPKPGDIKQGRIGDCYLLSCLSSLVRRNPGLVANMIKDYGDFFLVKLFERDGKSSREIYVKVSKAIVVDRLAKGPTQAKGDALWPAIIEKAFMTVNDGSLNGLFGGRGSGKDAYFQLTGIPGKSFVLSPSAALQRRSRFEHTNALPPDATRGRVIAQNRYLKYLASGLSKEATDKILALQLDTLTTKEREIVEIRLRQAEFSRLTIDPLLGRLPESARRKLVNLLALSPELRTLVSQFQETEGTDPVLLNRLSILVLIKKKDLENAVADFSKNAAMNYFNRLMAHLKKGGIAYLSTRDESAIKPSGIMPNHAYELVACSFKEGVPYLRLRNPWGHTGIKYDGDKMVPEKEAPEFDIQLTDALKYYWYATLGEIPTV